MSAATLDEYTSAKSKPANSNQAHSKDTVHAERARILETVSRKAQEKTLTLQETTDLYARFNQTYESTYRQTALAQEDESWALKLLEECAQESDTENSLETRVNGEPLKQATINHIYPSQTAKSKISKPAKKQPTRFLPTLNQTLFEEELEPEVFPSQRVEKPKLKLREAFIYDQFNLTEEATNNRTYSDANRTFWIILGVCSAMTCGALIVISQLMQ